VFPTCQAKQETASKANIIGIGKVVSIKGFIQHTSKTKIKQRYKQSGRDRKTTEVLCMVEFMALKLFAKS